MQHVLPHLRGQLVTNVAALGDDLSFKNVLTDGTLVSSRGPTLSLTRATASTTQDFEGLIRNILSGEARFEKLRRVENILDATSDDFTNANWNVSGVTKDSATQVTFNGVGTSNINDSVAPTGGVASKTYRLTATISRPAGAGTMRMNVSHVTVADNLVVINVDATPRRFSQIGVFSSAAGNGTVGFVFQNNAAGTTGTVVISNIVAEDVTGQANQNPSEYVSKGVASSPYHGAGVDGVKYFNTANANTVASNVVTEATGASLTLTAAGLRVNEAATNIVLQSEDFGTTWAAIGATSPTRVAANARCGSVVLDLLGDDSALAAEGYSQTVTFTGNAVKSITVYMKAGTSTNSLLRLRDTSAGADRLLIPIAWSGGVPTPTATTGTLEGTGVEALANGVYRLKFATTSVTATNTNVLEVYPAADAALDITATGTVNVGGVMVRNALTSAPYVKTTTAAVTVNADVVTASGVGVINQVEGTLYVKAIGPVGAAQVLFEIDDGTGNERVAIETSGSNSVHKVVDGGATVVSQTGAAWTAGVAKKSAIRYRLNDSNGAFDGTANTADTSCTMPTTTTIRLGFASAGFEPNTVVQEVRIYSAGRDDATIDADTTP